MTLIDVLPVLRLWLLTVSSCRVPSHRRDEKIPSFPSFLLDVIKTTKDPLSKVEVFRNNSHHIDDRPLIVVDAGDLLAVVHFVVQSASTNVASIEKKGKKRYRAAD